MNFFGTLLTWANGWLNHVALPGITAFAAGIIHDELPLAEKYVAQVITDVPADLAASKPLVALSQTLQAASAAALKDQVSVGIHALTVASTNAVTALAGQTPVTQVDAASALNAVEAQRAQALAKINADFDAQAKQLQDAATAAAAELKARVSN